MAQLRLRYGAYRHEASEAAVQIQRSLERTDAGEIYGVRETWSITGRLHGDTQTELSTNLAALEQAYSHTAESMALEFADGSGSTVHRIDPGDLLSPIEVIQPPSYPIGDGAQYCGFRDYQITVHALVKVSGGQPDLLAWEETYEMSGGFPRDVLVQTLNTPPIRQRAALATPFMVRQFGSATSGRGWPIPPLFLFDITSQAVLVENVVQKQGEKTTFINGVQKGQLYRTTWSYSFALPLPMAVPGPRRPTLQMVTLY